MRRVSCIPQVWPSVAEWPMTKPTWRQSTSAFQHSHQPALAASSCTRHALRSSCIHTPSFRRIISRIRRETLLPLLRSSCWAGNSISSPNLLRAYVSFRNSHEPYHHLAPSRQPHRPLRQQHHHKHVLLLHVRNAQCVPSPQHPSILQPLTLPQPSTPPSKAPST